MSDDDAAAERLTTPLSADVGEADVMVPPRRSVATAQWLRDWSTANRLRLLLVAAALSLVLCAVFFAIPNTLSTFILSPLMAVLSASFLTVAAATWWGHRQGLVDIREVFHDQPGSAVSLDDGDRQPVDTAQWWQAVSVAVSDEERDPPIR